jgi:hypothetical protein
VGEEYALFLVGPEGHLTGLLPSRYVAFVNHEREKDVTMLDVVPATNLEGRGGAKALRTVLAPYLIDRQQLVVATDRRLGRAVCITLAEPHTPVRWVNSTREIALPLLAAHPGWLAWLNGWLPG